MEKLLSVVIPVYNMEKYVQQTLDSLVCDMMDEMQIIIVNDGSTDGSLKIIQDWANKYPESAIVIDKENGGHGSAWNAGLNEATGRYLSFLDSDDWVVNISRVLERLHTASADIVFNDKLLYHEPDGKVHEEKVNGIGSRVYSFEEDGVPLGNNQLEIFNFQFCIYKTSLLKNIRFGEKTSYDDLLLFTMPLALANKYEYTGISFYVYRLGRSGQSMAPEVIIRRIQQQEAQRKYTINSALVLYPKGSTGLKANALHSIIRTIATRFYSYAMKIGNPQKFNYLTSWTEYVEKTVPDCQQIFEYRAYKKYPWPVYCLFIKIHHFHRKFFQS